jgi:AcrR family transcriptional regulator
MARTRPYVIAADPGPEGRREHKKARTREDLVQAALRLFEERGFDVTTVEDIAEAASVSPRTFFRYFANKEEVLFHRKDEELVRLENTLKSRPPGEPAFEALRATLIDYMERFQDEIDFHLLRIRLIQEAPSLEAYGLQLHQEWIRVLGRTLARRMNVRLSVDLRPSLLAGCAIIAMRSALWPWSQAKGTVAIGKFADQAFDQMKLGFPD